MRLLNTFETITMTKRLAPTTLMSSCSCKSVEPTSKATLTRRSIVEQPFKIPFVAAIAFYGNQVKSDITIEAMKRVGDRLQEAFNAGEWKEFKLLLRFFACLQGLYDDDGIFSFLGELFNTVVDLQSANENDVWLFPSTDAFTNHRHRSSVLNLSRSSFSPYPTPLLLEAAASTKRLRKFSTRLGLLPIICFPWRL